MAVGTSSQSAVALLFQEGSVSSFSATGDNALNVAYGSTVAIQPGALVTLAGDLKLGALTAGSSGSLVQTGGTLNVNGFDAANGNLALVIGEYPGETSTYSLSGGVLNVPNGWTFLPFNGGGNLNMSGGRRQSVWDYYYLRHHRLRQHLEPVGGGACYVGGGGIPQNNYLSIALSGGTLGPTRVGPLRCP